MAPSSTIGESFSSTVASGIRSATYRALAEFITRSSQARVSVDVGSTRTMVMSNR